jgi:hypothetical protein
LKVPGLLAAVVTAVLVCACGGPAADLFAVQRSGSIPGATLKLIPSSDGIVTCNGKQGELSSALLLDADNLASGIAPHARRGAKYPSGPHPVYTFVVTSPAGTFSFSDDSPHQGRTLYKLQQFIETVAKQICPKPKR